MAAVFKSTILSKFARNSSHTSKSYSLLPGGKRKLYVDKNDLLKIVLDKGVVAGDAEKVASFIEKSVEPAIRKAKYQEYKYLIVHRGDQFLSIGALFAVFTWVVGLANDVVQRKNEKQRKNDMKEKDK